MTSIMTVCTGNICRSPAAELLLKEYLGAEATVSSSGTHGMVGWGIPAEMLMCLDADNIDGRSHKAQQFSAGLARVSDLIICMTAEHRSRAVSEAPFALKRTFLLSEIATAARAGAPLEGGIAGVADAVQNFRVELAGRSLPDVPDPYRRSQRDYDEAYAMIRSAIEDIVGWARA
jgi:protein-tyrosine phosphatase